MRSAWAGGIALAALTAATAFAGDSSAREWYQNAANDGRTSSVDVEPIRNEPVVAWERKLDSRPLCGPVAWGGTVFLLTVDEQKRQVLTAIDVKTGAVAARTVRLSRTGEVAILAAWEGMVAVVEPTLIEGFAFKGASFKPSWRRDGTAFAFPCVHDGLMYVADSVKLDAASADTWRAQRVVAMADGKDLGRVLLDFQGFVSVTKPSRPGADAQIVGVYTGGSTRYQGTWLCARSSGINVSRQGGRTTVSFNSPAPDFPRASCEVELGQIRDSAPLRNWYGAIRMTPDSSGRGGAWLCLGGVDLRTATGEPCQVALLPDAGEGGLLPAVTRPAVRQGHAYSFNPQGDLLDISAAGEYFVLLDHATLPKGAERGAPSIARNVICFGNWAADLDSRRVLWVRPVTEKLMTPSIPVGDGMVLLVTLNGNLTCLKDPNAARPAASAPAAPAAPAAAAPLPKSMDGVLLADGRQVAGSVSVGPDGSVLVTPPGEAGRSFAAADVVVAEEDGKVVAHGAETEVHRVWRDALRAAYVKRLEELFEGALTMELPQKASDLLDRARRWGMSEARATDLARRVTGKRDAVNLDLRLNAFARKEKPADDATYAEVLAGAAWCGARGFRAAGATLLQLAVSVDKSRPDAEKAAAGLVPPEFPVKTGAAGALWMTWAPYVLASDAKFLGDTDGAWQRTRRAPWEKDTLGLRTPNLLFFTRSSDPAVAGPCLARGEETVRALHVLLGVEKTQAPATDDDRLEVRLHRNRDDYLKEAGNAFIESTTGYYMPGENVSRFYVPAAEDTHMPLGRGLFQTLCHELTHHYIDARWAPKHGGSSPNAGAAPGFWVVEGIARFVEDQVVDSESRGLTFADATVRSVDAAAQIARAKKLLHAEWFCDANQRAFHGLSQEPLLDVQLTRSLVQYRLGAMHVFYEQAGALVFFLWNHRGAEGRAAFIEYLRQHYNGVLPSRSWRQLGFSTPKALDDAFGEWLATLGR